MRILFATDGSPSAEQARDALASLAWPRGTAITLLTVFGLPPVWLTEASMATGQLLTSDLETVRRQAEADLEKVAAPLSGRGWTLQWRAVHGRPASVILETADQLEADLIVLGSRGHGSIASMLLGSVSAEVADRARCSVLVARSARLTSTLIATDGSPCSRVIPGVLELWGVFAGLPSMAVSVTPVDSPAFEVMVKLYTLGGYPLEAEKAELRDRSREFAMSMAKGLSDIGVPAQPEVREGDAADEIIRLAAESGTDLVITGSHCLHGVDRWFMGSVARNVLLHTHASVLIVRPMAERA